MTQRHKSSEQIVNLGLVCNVGLALLKTAFGILGNSAGLLADGINSTSDVVYYGVVKVFMRLSAKPADRQHPYGHAQMETIAALVVGAFIVTTAVGIFWKSVSDIYLLIAGENESVSLGRGTLTVALFTVLLKIALTAVTTRAARKTGNAAVRALASDHRNDVLSAGAVAVGIVFAQRGHAWVDPLAGALVALLILSTGLAILRQSSNDLMDTLPDRPLGQQVRDIALSVEGVRAAEEIHAHRFGPYFVVNLTVGVEGGLTVAEGDRIASQVEHAVTNSLELVRRVYVHCHPAAE